MFCLLSSVDYIDRVCNLLALQAVAKTKLIKNVVEAEVRISRRLVELSAHKLSNGFIQRCDAIVRECNDHNTEYAVGNHKNTVLS